MPDRSVEHKEQLSESALSTWNVTEDEFPKKGAWSEKISFILKYAILAPSGHNTQPWLFKIVEDKTIELYADPRNSVGKEQWRLSGLRLLLQEKCPTTTIGCL